MRVKGLKQQGGWSGSCGISGQGHVRTNVPGLSQGPGAAAGVLQGTAARPGVSPRPCPGPPGPAHWPGLKLTPSEQVLSVVLGTPEWVGRAGAGSCRPGVVSCLLVLDTARVEPRGQEAEIQTCAGL